MVAQEQSRQIIDLRPIVQPNDEEPVGPVASDTTPKVPRWIGPSWRYRMHPAAWKSSRTWSVRGPMTRWGPCPIQGTLNLNLCEDVLIFSHVSIPFLQIRPPRQFGVPVPTACLAVEPNSAGDDDTGCAPGDRVQRQKWTQTVNTQWPDQIADQVTEVRVRMGRCCDGFAFAGVHGGQNQRAM